MHEAYRNCIEKMEALYALTRFRSETIHNTLNQKRKQKGKPEEEWKVHYKEDSLGERPSITLPAPKQIDSPLGDCIEQRRSIRAFSSKNLSLENLSTLVHLSVGRTPGNEAEQCSRVYPSAGSLYPLDTYLICTNVDELEPGIYHFGHRSGKLLQLQKIADAHIIQGLFGLLHAPPNCMIWVASLDRILAKYAANAYRFACIEAGHIAQNTSLACHALQLAAFALGGFDNERIETLLQLGEREWPIYAMAFGAK